MVPPIQASCEPGTTVLPWPKDPSVKSHQISTTGLSFWSLQNPGRGPGLHYDWDTQSSRVGDQSPDSILEPSPLLAIAKFKPSYLGMIMSTFSSASFQWLRCSLEDELVQIPSYRTPLPGQVTETQTFVLETGAVTGR